MFTVQKQGVIIKVRRLTAYELVYEKIPSTLICDSMVAAVLSSQNVSAIVVGADRVAANGDTANKIGTLQLAILTKHYNVPFYVAAPSTSIDLTLPNGAKIPIEERSSKEMTHIANVPLHLQYSMFKLSFETYHQFLLTEFSLTAGHSL